MESNNENGWRMEELLESKSFDELTSDEREFVLRELGSEEQYNVLRKISTALVADKADLSPDPRVLSKLQKEHRKRYATSWFRNTFEYKIPAYMVAAPIVLIAFLGLRAYWSDRTERYRVITKVNVDTLYISKPADTVFVDRVVVKYLPSEKSATPDYSLVRNTQEDINPGEGVNMKEKEELERFLVSGS